MFIVWEVYCPRVKNNSPAGMQKTVLMDNFLNKKLINDYFLDPLSHSGDLLLWASVYCPSSIVRD